MCSDFLTKNQYVGSRYPRSRGIYSSILLQQGGWAIQEIAFPGMKPKNIIRGGATKE